MIKRALLRIGGVAAYTVPPLAYLATKYEMFVAKEAGTSLSAYGIVGIIAVLPLLGYYIKKIPFRPSFIGIFMTAFGLIGMYAGETLAIVGGLILGGGCLGQAMFKRADINKANVEKEKFAETVAIKLQEIK
jgi:hypothetical protein